MYKRDTHIMASEASSTAKLLMLSSPKASTSSSLSSPPHQTSASVPFLWEEEPGKPRPCTALIPLPPHPKCLELPPRLQPMEHSRLFTKTPSPTTVLDGPYVGKNGTFSSSFRIFSRSKRHDSFHYRFSGRFSPERAQIGALFLNEKQSKKGLLGNSRGQMHKSGKLVGSKQEFAEEGSFVISPSWDDVSTFAEEDDEKECDDNGIPAKDQMTNLSHAKSHFWTTMCEGFKHAIPWKSRKLKKQVHIV